jgi:formylglycine-generating enzyme required for sulfatase activity
MTDSPKRFFARNAQGLLVVVLLMAVSLSTVVRAQTSPWEEVHYNPKPAQGDVVLPMPCGGNMVFRSVLIPLEKPLDDFPVMLGSSSDEWGFLESAQASHIAGSFAAQEGERGRYYLIGKYEVTRLQYDAIMSGKCDKPTINLRVPQTGISWFAALDFGDRYTQWLQANASDRLPREEGIPGFLRLPTEVEWAFATQGGLSVTPSDFQERVFPMDGALSQYVWFAGPQSSNGRIRPIGLLEPNPLGLHDVLGNADEMMFEPFRLRTHGRSHGQAGGFVVRGGNYLTPQSDIRTSWRVEQPYYRDGQQNKLPTTGFRLVVVAPAITSVERLQALEADWLARGTGPVTAAGGPDASARIDKLASSADTESARQELNQVRDQLRAANQLQREQRERAVRSSLQLGGFFCTQLNQLGREIARRKDFLATSCDPQNPRSGAETCKNIQTATAQTEASLQTILGLYSDTIVELGSIYLETDVADQAKVVTQTLASRKSINLIPFINVYVADLSGYMQDRKVQRDTWLANCRAVVQ